MTTASAVELRDVRKTYDGVEAVKGLHLDIAEGQFVTLLGPSGCGKTTTLRMVAGLEMASEGDILIKGRRVNDVPIHRRNLGMVFQNFALFPHMTVAQNVGYGLKLRKTSRAEARARVGKALERVRLPQLQDRLPSQLSGGQQQRVALARAIVIEPDVLLLDEPLSSLDANLREEMRLELKSIQRDLGITTLFVTHDQAEALALSDKIVVMNQGRVEQEGAPSQVYRRPCNRFVAEFLGISNFLEGPVASDRGIPMLALGGGQHLRLPAALNGAAGDGRVRLVVRAERVRVGRDLPIAPDASRLQGIITAVDYQGSTVRYVVDLGGQRLQALNMIEGEPFAEGEQIQIAIQEQDCVLVDG
ncbi:MAG: putative spermidine/putrescine transport system ATP-binding protein [Rhodospirillaceae bacterium]|nr:putative spermidine/putrescine transport system ATP-binding protein [Rhodospirillaceae bacterium]